MSTDQFELDETQETILPAAEPETFFKKHQIWLIGISLLAVSQLLFALPMRNSENVRWGGSGSFSEQFIFVNFVIVLIYAIVLWYNKRLRWWIFGSRRAEYGTTLVYLMLWMTSCYALNTEISMFNISAGWLSVFLTIGGLASCVFELRDRLPRFGRTILFGLLSAFGVLAAYLTLYLAPILPFSIAFCWFFGLSLHSFVPLVLTIYLIFILKNEWREREKSRPAIFTGIVLPILISAIFTIFWAIRVESINKITREQSFTQKTSLPTWIGIAQKLPADALSERVLQSGDYFQTFDHNFRGDWFFPNTLNNIQRVHDPLVFIGSYFANPPALERAESAKILKAVFGKRHDFQEKLWSGFDLKITEISEKIHLDPAHRLAYTEKTFTILNENTRSWNQQEALFTFQLPIGAAVTSLSLWVEGVERPAFLTAKSKADSAYATIVGQERRDPALVTWQEGSMVTLRVFPVTPINSRRVKIGITSPLRLDGDGLFYDEIQFDGPPTTSADETIELTSLGQKLTESPSFFNKKAENALAFTGKFRPDWSVKMPIGTLDSTAFSFDGKTYRARKFGELPMDAYKPSNIYYENVPVENFKPTAIYLDLNSAFSKADFDEIWGIARSKNIPLRAWLGGERLIELDSEATAREAFEFLKKDRFSLFPIHKIPDPATAILVTASGGPTPNISDLKNSGFAEGFKKMAAPSRPLRTFHFGKNCQSSFLNSLADFRIIDLHFGETSALTALLRNENFPQNIENERIVKIYSSNMAIEETTGEVYEAGKGSDQLMRLFAEQQILRQIGHNFFSKKYEPEPLGKIAEQAYIVSPVSSLVVLETDADYERFDIKKPENSLSNATMPQGGILKKKEVPLPGEGLQNAAGNNSGSVPEPGEWAMILMFSLVAFWLMRRKN